MTLHLTLFVGGNALSPFRARQLLPQLQSIAPRIDAVRARYVHWAATPSVPTPAQAQQLAALLNYGEPFEGGDAGQAIVVAPRLGTVSPWASKASDIAHNCGLDAVSYTHLRAHETVLDLVCRLLLEKKTKTDELPSKLLMFL